MTTNQFTIYAANDVQGPGYLNGLTGSLITILNACLINGYGTGSYYKAPAGWTKPLTDISSSAGSLPLLACYQQGTGSQFVLFVNDSGPHTSALGKETWITGWESMISLTGSGLSPSAIGAYTGSNSQGFGYGQFPLPAQSLTYGHVVWRKSNTADTTNRFWVMAADAATMYLWIVSGDYATNYYHCSFGDCYSLAGPNDLWNCYIIGRYTENNATTSGNDLTDGISQGNQTAHAQQLYVAMSGHYMDRTAWGSGTSLPFTKKGDAGVSYTLVGSTPNSVAIHGVLAIPNGGDNSLYMCPLYILEPSGSLLRGRFRGMYQVGHRTSNFIDGQIISGSAQYNGKIFKIVSQSPNNSFWALEISPTVEFN